MAPENFAYWLQGFAELSGDAPTAEQWQSIRDHLQLVFEKKTPVIPALTYPPIRTMELRPSDVLNHATCRGHTDGQPTQTDQGLPRSEPGRNQPDE